MYLRCLTSVAAIAIAAPSHAEVTTSAPQAPATPGAADTPAPPELALGDAQLVLAPRRGLFDDDSQDPYLRYAGFAQLTGGGSAGGDLGVGAAGALGGLGCDVVAGSVQGRVRPAVDPRLVGDARWSVCLSRIGITAVFDGRDGIGIAPALDARRSLWSRRYDENYRRVTLALGEGWRPGSPHRHSVFVMALGHGTTAQADGADRRNIAELDLDFALYRHRHLTDRHELVVETLVLTSDAVKAGDSNKGGVTYNVMPARVRLATHDVYVAAEAGVGHTGGSTRASTSSEVNGRVVSSWMDEIDGEGLPVMKALIGSVATGIERNGVDAGARVSRAFYPTFDGNLALEERLAATVAWTEPGRHPTSIALAPFVAHTRTWTRDAGSGDAIGFGASVRAGYVLTDLLHLDAIGEAGRTPYARLDGARLADTLGGQLVVALTARAAR